MLQALWKIVWRFLKKLKIELSYDPSITLLGTYLGEKKNTNSKRYINPKVQSSTIDNGQDMNANQMFMNKWIKTIWCVCTVEYYTAIKAKFCHSAMWMDLQNIMLNEDRQNRFL